jgi:hypothetical protein
MELDLLAYRFQIDPPIGSQCETHGRRALEIHFPVKTEYQSEGRQVVLKSKTPIRAANAIVTSTTFLQSGLKIWHLTLTPSRGGAFSEYDLIKLIHLYDGRSERTSLADVIRFRHADSAPVTAVELLQTLCPDASKIGPPRAGTLEILTDSEETDESGGSDVLEKVKVARDKGGDALGDLRAWMETDSRERRILCAFSGIVTGILDFHHLDAEEAMDSLDPTLPDISGLVRIHRCTLSSIVADDRIMRECSSDVGISPYLIIPHAAILHNEVMSDAAESAIEAPLSTKNPSTQELENAHARAEECLFRAYLPNIFNYSTERELFEKAEAARGSIDKYTATKAKLHELNGKINSHWESRRDRGQMAIAVLLALISVLQLKEIVFEVAGGGISEASRWTLLGLIGFLMALAIIGFWRMGVRR